MRAVSPLSSAPHGSAALVSDAVTVVIPTTGRPTLVRAVQSALEQQDVVVDIHVVADVPRATRSSLGLSSIAEVSLHSTGGGRGGAIARQIGTDVASTPWIAYLDDDDTWTPRKLERQIAAARTQPAPVRAIVSCRALSRPRNTGTAVAVPRELFTGGDVATYLFHRRRLSAARNTLQTSTVLLPTELAREVGWDPALTRHQDWDFVWRASRAPAAALIQLPDVLVELGFGSNGSVSRTADWRASLDWALANEAAWPRPAFADFVAGQPLRYAVQGRSVRGIATSVATLVAHRSRPSVRAVALGASGALPRTGFERAMHLRGRRSFGPVAAEHACVDARRAAQPWLA